MILLPAIDIYKGECVRLTQGVFKSSKRVADSWLETAKTFEGSKNAHMVTAPMISNTRPSNSTSPFLHLPFFFFSTD